MKKFISVVAVLFCTCLFGWSANRLVCTSVRQTLQLPGNVQEPDLPTQVIKYHELNDGLLNVKYDFTFEYNGGNDFDSVGRVDIMIPAFAFKKILSSSFTGNVEIQYFDLVPDSSNSSNLIFRKYGSEPYKKDSDLISITFNPSTRIVNCSIVIQLCLAAYNNKDLEIEIREYGVDDHWYGAGKLYNAGKGYFTLQVRDIAKFDTTVNIRCNNRYGKLADFNYKGRSTMDVSNYGYPLNYYVASIDRNVGDIYVCIDVFVTENYPEDALGSNYFMAFEYAVVDEEGLYEKLKVGQNHFEYRIPKNSLFDGKRYNFGYFNEKRNATRMMQNLGVVLFEFK